MKRITTLIAICLLAVSTKAADLLVEEFGLSPAYNSISAAVTAASDGDRIIIKNRTGAIPWVEDITVNKSLTFVSYVNDSFFIVQGNWTIVPASGREVIIIGMLNTTGSLQATTNGTGTRTTVRIMDSHLQNGGMYFYYNGFDMKIIGNKLDNGYVSIKYGDVIGNDITYTGSTTSLYIGPDGTADNAVLKIVGNRVTNASSSTGNGEAFDWANTTQFFDIRNNFFEAKTTCLLISNTKASNATLNTIYNNSIKINAGYTGSASFYGIYLSGVGSTSIVEVMNNIVDLSATGTSPTFYGIYSGTGSGQRNLYYNAVDNSSALDNQISGSWTVNTNNITTQAITIGSTGIPTAGVATNAGNPANPFYDIDLTPNDLGCYGGSYTQSNFFPLFSGAARVYYVNYPFNIRQGNTLNVSGQSFDR